MTTLPRIRHNYWAILTAAVACFAFEAVWYTIFLNSWLAGIGRTAQWLESAAGYHPVLQYSTAFVSSALIAIGIDCVTQLTGPQTAARAVKIGLLMWLGFVLTTICTEYVFEERPLSLYGINIGFWFFGFIVMGAIVGAWKKKPVAVPAAVSMAR